MNANTTFGRRACGFTLTEILVALAVVAVLAAIAIPAYQSYVVRSRVAEGFELADAARIQVILKRMEGGQDVVLGFETLEKPAGHVVSLRWYSASNANWRGDTIIGYLMPVMNLPGLGMRDAFALEYLANGDWRCVNAAVAAGHSVLSRNQALDDKHLPALCRSGAGTMTPHPQAPAGCPPGTQPTQTPDSNGKMLQICLKTASNPQPTLQPSLQAQAPLQAQAQIQQPAQQPVQQQLPPAQQPVQQQSAPVQQTAVPCSSGQDCTYKDPQCPVGQEYFAGGKFQQFAPIRPDESVVAERAPLVVGAGCVAKCRSGYAFNPADTKACGVAPATNVHLCRGPKFICERAHAPQGNCPANMPYAANIVENLQDGSRYVVRTCITQQQAFNAVRNNPPTCKPYFTNGNDDHFAVAGRFFCIFPCLGNKCNADIVPKGGIVEWEPGKSAKDLPKGYPRGSAR